MISRISKITKKFQSLPELSSLSAKHGTILIMIMAACTFGRYYWLPPLLYWDEGYHVPSAQKYLEGIFFLEPHPPFGKMVIAAGEVIIPVNDATDQYISTMYGESISGFSMLGYRLFPVIFSIFAAALFFRLLVFAIGRVDWAFLLGICFLLDTALVLHLRGAMLEGVQICFLLATVLSGCELLTGGQSKKLLLRKSASLGAAFALAVTTKITSLFLLVTIPLLLFFLFKKHLRPLLCLTVSSFTFFLVASVIMYVHFLLLPNINPMLEESGGFGMDPTSVEIIRNGGGAKLSNLPTLMWEYIHYIKEYNFRIPSSDANGSPAYLWPLGGQSIRYLTAPYEGKGLYLYLQVNPIVWVVSLLGVIGGFVVTIKKVLSWKHFRMKHDKIIFVLFTLYLAYMIPMLSIGRVMYLYHYFIAFLIGIVLFGLILDSLKALGAKPIDEGMKENLLYGIVSASFVAFLYFSPLIYFKPLSDSELAARSWLPNWDLRCQKCDYRDDSM